MTRYAKLYYWRNECHTLKRWAQILNIPLSTLYSREWDGASGDTLFAPVVNYTVPVSKSRPVVLRRLQRVIHGRKTLGLDTMHLEIDLYYVTRGMEKVG